MAKGYLLVNDDGTASAADAVAADNLVTLGQLGSITGWATTGNVGLGDHVDNFIGTNDTVNLNIVVDGQPAGRIERANSLGNLALGYHAGKLENNSSGAFECTAIGTQALEDNVIGNHNTALGAHALANTTGNSNTGLGHSAGSNNVSGINNIYIKGDANANNLNGVIAIGGTATASNQFVIRSAVTHLNFPLNAHSAGYVLTSDGTGIADWQLAPGSLWELGAGTDALMDSRSTSAAGDTNFTVGVGSVNGGTNSIVIGNGITCNTNFAVAIGELALNSNSGIGPIGIGQSAGKSNTGISLVAIGDNVGQDNTGDYVVGIGPFAAFQNTGDNVVAIGGFGTSSHPTASGNTGNNVTAIGSGAAYNNTRSNVIALGKDAAPAANNEFVIDASIDHLKFPLNSHSSGAVLTSAGSGVATWQTPTLVASGTWTPSYNNFTNISSSNNTLSGQWMRVGNTVTCSFMAELTITSGGGVSTACDVTLPVASNFGASYDACGTGFAGITPGHAIGVFANTSTDKLRLEFYAPGTGAINFSVHCTYQVI